MIGRRINLTAALPGGTIVRIIFSDESGVGSVAKEPFTVVTAIMLNPDSQWGPFIDEIESIAAETSGEFEFKGNKLFSDLRRGRPLAKVVLEKALALPSKHQIPIFYGAIDRAGYERASDYLGKLKEPVFKALKRTVRRQDLAFHDCLNRVNTYVNTFAPKEKILWLADEAGQLKECKKTELAFHRLVALTSERARELEEENRRTGKSSPESEVVFGTVRLGLAGLSAQPTNSHIIDTIYFGDSRESRALQLADLCCSVITAHLRSIYTPDKNAHIASEYYPLVRGQVVNDGTPPGFSKYRVGLAL